MHRKLCTAVHNFVRPVYKSCELPVHSVCSFSKLCMHLKGIHFVHKFCTGCVSKNINDSNMLKDLHREVGDLLLLEKIKNYF
jgi:hypothetical protein